MAGILNSTERSLRSVFVGNIPYDATEEKLKDIFSEVGPVISFRLVYDRETGKPKGYGFCEYKDQETAMSAMRNLNATELNGRTLRVDNAANERAREEIRNLQVSLGGSFESPYGPESDPEKAPEAISKAVASLPPEQMFELAKQMKQCIQTNPNEARNMLIQNPQLAYALLQALVVMRVVEPQMAMSILHRPPPSSATLVSQEMGGPIGGAGMPPIQQQQNQPFIDPQAQFAAQQRNAMMNPGGFAGPVQGGSFDPRYREVTHPNPAVFDPRIAAASSLATANVPQMAVDPRTDPRKDPRIDPRLARQQQQQQQQQQTNVDPRLAAQLAAQQAMQMTRNVNAPVGGVGAVGFGGLAGQGQEQEKAQLIMKVLELTDQQIAMLPPEQRQSILALKDQINRGTH